MFWEFQVHFFVRGLFEAYRFVLIFIVQEVDSAGGFVFTVSEEVQLLYTKYFFKTTGLINKHEKI